jgi:hypothetical protein
VVEHDAVVVVHDLGLVAELDRLAEPALGDRASVTVVQADPPAGPVQGENVFEISSARLPGLTRDRWDLVWCGVFPLVAAPVRLRSDGRAVATD